MPDEGKPVIEFEDEGKYEIKGQRFTAQEILAIGKWIEDHQDDLEGQAEYDEDQEKEQLLQLLRDTAGEGYEIEQDGDEVTIYPVGYSELDPEDRSTAEAYRFSYTVEELKEYIGHFGGEID